MILTHQLANQVFSMDWLGRSLDHLVAMVQRLNRKGVRVEFIKEKLVFAGRTPHTSPWPSICSSQNHQREVEIGSEYEMVGPESSSVSCQAAKSEYDMNE